MSYSTAWYFRWKIHHNVSSSAPVESVLRHFQASNVFDNADHHVDNCSESSFDVLSQTWDRSIVSSLFPHHPPCNSPYLCSSLSFRTIRVCFCLYEMRWCDSRDTRRTLLHTESHKLTQGQGFVQLEQWEDLRKLTSTSHKFQKDSRLMYRRIVCFRLRGVIHSTSVREWGTARLEHVFEHVKCDRVVFVSHLVKSRFHFLMHRLTNVVTHTNSGTHAVHDREKSDNFVWAFQDRSCVMRVRSLSLVNVRSANDVRWNVLTGTYIYCYPLYYY